jgi:hypothetical protein
VWSTSPTWAGNSRASRAWSGESPRRRCRPTSPDGAGRRRSGSGATGRCPGRWGRSGARAAAPGPSPRAATVRERKHGVATGRRRSPGERLEVHARSGDCHGAACPRLPSQRAVRNTAGGRCLPAEPPAEAGSTP